MTLTNTRWVSDSDRWEGWRRKVIQWGPEPRYQVDLYNKIYSHKFSEKERKKVEDRWGNQVDKENKFYVEKKYISDINYVKPNDMDIQVDGVNYNFASFLHSCPCEVCGHTTMIECEIAGCKCCSESCT